MIEFLINTLILVVTWFFFLDSLREVFFDMSWYITVISCWYVRNFSLTEFLWLVPVFPASCAGTLLLRFYIKGFFILSWSSSSWLFFHLVKFIQKLVTVLLVVKGLFSSSNCSIEFLRWSSNIQVSLVVCESSFSIHWFVRLSSVGILWVVIFWWPILWGLLLRPLFST